MKGILVVALLVSLIAVGAHAETPEWSSIEKFKVPKAKDYRIVVSADDSVVVFYDGSVHTVPDVERYAKLFAHVDQHFVTTKANVALHIYIHSWKKFERSMNNAWPAGAEQLRQGWAVYYAYTYVSTGKDPVMVIETYQLPTDNVIIHELLHHYLNRIVRDGSLNNEELTSEYSYHVESVFRTTLEKEF